MPSLLDFGSKRDLKWISVSGKPCSSAGSYFVTCRRSKTPSLSDFGRERLSEVV